MILNPKELPPRERHKIATGTILPRPIAWVSSLNGQGVSNLAPYSFFTVAGSDPLTLIFCPSRKGDGSKKDSWRNAEETGEFVVNLVNLETAEAMNLTATAFDGDVSEFEMVGLTPVPSVEVKALRVAESPVSYECRLQHIVEVGQTAVIFGEVVCIHIRDGIYDGNHISLERLQPIGRLAGNWYCQINDIFELVRQSDPAQIKRR